MDVRSRIFGSWIISCCALYGASVCALGTVGCSAEDGDSNQSNVVRVRGTVVDANGVALAGVRVEGQSASTTSSTDGSFEIEGPSTGPIVLIFRQDGFVRGLERLDVSTGGDVPLRVTMIPMAEAIPFDSSAGGEVVGMRGATMIASPDVFRDKEGNPVTGMVNVHLTPLNPSVEAELDAYPGDGLARDAEGETIHLETFGVLDVTVKQGDTELTIRDGMGVTIKVPLPDPLPSDPPPSIALWGFDDVAGVWVEEGIATLNVDEGMYEGTIGHLSPWNCDQPMSATCIKGRALDGAGGPAAGSYIIARGNDYSGASTAVADGDGHFCVPVRKDSSVTVTVHGPNGGETEQAIQSGGAETDVPPVCTDPRCQDLGDFLMADEGDSGGWDSSCDWGEDAGLEMQVSGYYDGSLAWEGEPCLAVCGGIAGGATDGNNILVFPGTMSDSGLSVNLVTEVGLGGTGENLPLTILFSEGASTPGADSWITSGCTADISRNELIAPAVYQVEGRGRCSGPATPAFGDKPDLNIDGEFEFSGIVVSGEAATDTLVQCCYGGIIPPV